MPQLIVDITEEQMGLILNHFFQPVHDEGDPDGFSFKLDCFLQCTELTVETRWKELYIGNVNTNFDKIITHENIVAEHSVDAELLKYIAKITTYQLIEREQEKSKFSQKMNQVVFDEIFNSYLLATFNICAEYFDKNVMKKKFEIINYGRKGLKNAISNFDENRDISFMTYARYFIIQSILEYVNDKKASLPKPTKFLVDPE